MATAPQKDAPASGSASTAARATAQRDDAAELATLRSRLEAAQTYLRLDELSARLAELEVELAQTDLWSDQDRARKVNTEYGRVKSDVELLTGLGSQLVYAEELLAIGLDEGEAGLAEIAAELDETIATIASALDDIELRSLFSGEHDEADAIAEIHAGAGGTDAQDWAEMMLRMYQRWAERRGFEVEIDEVSEGQEAGILSATFIVHGPYAYGLLATERGVHRLVRMSPFDSQHRRQTSFASLDVVPFLEDVSEVEIDEKDLRVDTYRSSGAGGQHVNKTDSAIRLTHLPTGIVVSCQNERSQHQNKAKAMQILAAKLADLQRAARRAELDALTGPESDNAWGSQIRSYVMAPYQLVKDLRSGYETGNVEAFLDGDIDDAMVAFLRWKREHSG
jgi:peptide chain release factor 2